MEKQVLTQEEIQSLKNIQNNQSLLIEQLGLLFKEGKLNDLKTSFAYLYLLKESCD